jgi:hypothetical protein
MDKEQIEFPFRKAFLEGFKTYPNTEISEVYRHIFSCMEMERIEEMLKYLQGEVNNEDWFYSFHKSMRQTDFFGYLNVPYTINTQTESDQKRLEELSQVLPFHGKKGRIWEDVVNSEEAKELGLEEEMNEFRFLKGKSKIEKKRNVSGHMDMILWNLIYMDKTNFLKVFIERFFKLQEAQNIA